MAPNPLHSRHAMYHSAQVTIKPCQSSSRRVTGEIPVERWNASETSTTNVMKWRTWKANDSNRSEDSLGDDKTEDDSTTSKEKPPADSLNEHHDRYLSNSKASPRLVLSANRRILSIASNPHRRQDQSQPLQSSSISNVCQQAPSPVPALPQTPILWERQPTVTEVYIDRAPTTVQVKDISNEREFQARTATPRIATKITSTTTTTAKSNTVDTITYNDTDLSCDDRLRPAVATTQSCFTSDVRAAATPIVGAIPVPSPLMADVDDAELERRRHAIALEQQQRILRQVEAVRQAKQQQMKMKQNKRQHRPRSSQQLPSRINHPKSSTPISAAATLDTTTTINPTTKSLHSPPAAAKTQCKLTKTSHESQKNGSCRSHRRRPPRTEGLLFQRRANGKLVAID